MKRKEPNAEPVEEPWAGNTQIPVISKNDSGHARGEIGMRQSVSYMTYIITVEEFATEYEGRHSRCRACGENVREDTLPHVH
jgi:hypothetical protein